MRKVLFKKWIEVEYFLVNGSNKRVAKTGCFANEYTEKGVFHQWANACIEFESSAGNYTVAIVELPDGTISEVPPSNIKFIEPITIS
jgi:hypothetical protein